MSETAKWQPDTTTHNHYLEAEGLAYINSLETSLAEAQGVKAELHEATGRLSERLDEVLEQLAEAQKERDELTTLFDMQWKRDIELITQWRKEGRVDPLTMPDYGKAQTWLLERAEAAEQQLAEVRTSHLAAERELIESESRCERLQTKLAELESFKRELERRHAV